MNEATELVSEANIQEDKLLIHNDTKPRVPIGTWIRVAIVSVFMFLCAGLAMGYNALKPALVDSGIFDNLCNNTLQQNYTAPCLDQEQALDGMFAYSGGAVNASGYVVGILLDLLGRRVIMFSSGLTWGGFCLLFAFSTNAIPAYTPAFIGMTVSGLCMFFSGISYANPIEAPGWEGFVAGLLTAMWDTSSLVFYFFNLIYFAGVSLKWIFASYSIIAVGVVTFALVMNGGIAKEIRDFATKCKKGALCQLPKPDPNKTHGQRFLAVVYYIIPYSDLLHLELWASYVYSGFAILHLYLYMATLRRQLAAVNGNDLKTTETQISVFSILLPVLGTAVAILMGKVKDWLGGAQHASRSFWLLLPFNAVLFVCMLIPNSPLQYFTFVVFVSWRIMFFVLMNAFVPAAPYYSPSAKFKLLSIGYLIGGLLATFTIRPIDEFVERTWNGNFFWTNVILGSGSLITNVLVALATYRKERIWAKKNYEEIEE